MNTLASEKKLAVIASLLEGSSVRSTERMTGVHRDTICRLLVETGENCAVLLDLNMRDVRAKYLQADEIWTYVGKKDKHVRVDDPGRIRQSVGIRRDGRRNQIGAVIRGWQAHPRNHLQVSSGLGKAP